MKLFDHFKRMQDCAGHFIEPGEYIAINGNGYEKQIGKDKAFANDMIYMLDGPEQREAEAELDDFLAKHLADREALLQENGKLCERVEQYGTDLRAVREDNNDLRSRLMASELAYAKLIGYIEAKQDAEPPVMVPQQRENFFARMPDATFGTTSPDWRRTGAGRTVKHWYHR